MDRLAKMLCRANVVHEREVFMLRIRCDILTDDGEGNRAWIDAILTLRMRTEVWFDARDAASRDIGYRYIPFYVDARGNTRSDYESILREVLGYVDTPILLCPQSLSRRRDESDECTSKLTQR
jgi:hypothetical protein